MAKSHANGHMSNRSHEGLLAACGVLAALLATAGGPARGGGRRMTRGAMYKHPISREPTPFSVTTVEPDEADACTRRLQDIGDFACCAAFALLSFATTAWLWWGVISMPALR